MPVKRERRRVVRGFWQGGRVRLFTLLFVLALAALLATFANRSLYARGRYGGTIAITSVRPRPGRPHRAPFTVRLKGKWSPGEDQDADLYRIEIVWGDAGAKTWIGSPPGDDDPPPSSWSAEHEVTRRGEYLIQARLYHIWERQVEDWVIIQAEEPPTPTPTRTPKPTPTPTRTPKPTPTPKPPTPTPTPTNTPTPTPTPTNTPTPTPTPTPTNTPTPTPTPTNTPTPTPTPTPIVPDPVIGVRADRDQISAGDLVRFTIEVTNRGNLAATQAVIEDQLPRYLNVVTVETTLGIPSVWDNLVSVRVGRIAPGQTVTVTIDCIAGAETEAGKVIENCAELSYAEGEARTRCLK